MSLKYPGEWKFDGCGIEMSQEAVSAFADLMVRIADGSKPVLEEFKTAFGSRFPSSSYDWAESDLHRAASDAAPNAATFMDALWRGIESADEAGCTVPNNDHINGLLEKFGVPLRIDPPNLVRVDFDSIVRDGSEDIADTEKENDIPTYVLQEQLGAGGYGIVYKAVRQTTAGDFVYAVKMLDPSPFVEDQGKALKRFRREVAILASLQHKSIVPLLDAGISSGGKPYIVMPLVEGPDLVSSCQSESVAFTIWCFMEILEALSYAHACNVVHRDLKPSNILVRHTDNQPLILDFGSAYTLDQMDSKTLTTAAVGTIGYIPSEVLMDPKKRSPLHDLFACGVVLYEVLAGKKPDPSDYVPLESMRTDCPGLDQIIREAIAGESNRTRTADNFRTQLAELV